MERRARLALLAGRRIGAGYLIARAGHKTPAKVMHYVHAFGQHIDAAIGGLNIGMSDAVTPDLHTAIEVVREAVPTAASIRIGK